MKITRVSVYQFRYQFAEGKHVDTVDTTVDPQIDMLGEPSIEFSL